MSYFQLFTLQVPLAFFMLHFLPSFFMLFYFYQKYAEHMYLFI